MQRVRICVQDTVDARQTISADAGVDMKDMIALSDHVPMLRRGPSTTRRDPTIMPNVQAKEFAIGQQGCASAFLVMTAEAAREVHVRMDAAAMVPAD